MRPISTFTIQALEQAINRARLAEPARGQEATLAPDVKILAELYGWMIFEKRPDLSPDLLNARELEVVSRWLQ